MIRPMSEKTKGKDFSTVTDTNCSLYKTTNPMIYAGIKNISTRPTVRKSSFLPAHFSGFHKYPYINESRFHSFIHKM